MTYWICFLFFVFFRWHYITVFFQGGGSRKVTLFFIACLRVAEFSIEINNKSMNQIKIGTTTAITIVNQRIKNHFSSRIFLFRGKFSDNENFFVLKKVSQKQKKTQWWWCSILVENFLNKNKEKNFFLFWEKIKKMFKRQWLFFRWGGGDSTFNFFIL